MVWHRELMASYRAVMYQSCRTCVEFRNCQGSPSVYVPCNLAVSLSCCTREQVIHQKRNIINYPSALQSTFFLSFFSPNLLISHQSWKEFWECGMFGLSESWPLCSDPQPVPTKFFWSQRCLFSKHWTVLEKEKQITKKLHCRSWCFPLDLRGLAQLTVPEKKNPVPASECACTFAVCMCVYFPYTFEGKTIITIKGTQEKNGGKIVS